MAKDDAKGFIDTLTKDLTDVLTKKAQEIGGSAVDYLNGANRDQMSAIGQELHTKLDLISKILDPDGNKNIGPTEVLTLLSDKDRVAQALKDAGPHREELKQALMVTRGALGAACAALPTETLDNGLKQIQQSINDGLVSAQITSQMGLTGALANTLLQGAEFPSTLTSAGQKNVNEITETVTSNLPKDIKLPGAQEVCEAVQGENPLFPAQKDLPLQKDGGQGWKK